MEEGIDEAPEAARTLRLVKALTVTLTGAMVAGVIAIVALLVIRLPDGSLPLPEAIALPDGTAPLAFTRGPDWIAVTTAETILIYDLAGALRQTVAIEKP